MGGTDGRMCGFPCNFMIVLIRCDLLTVAFDRLTVFTVAAPVVWNSLPPHL